MSEELSVNMQPAPFPANVIRHAAFEGKQMLYHIQSRDEEPYLRLTTYLEVYDDHVVFEFETPRSGGQPHRRPGGREFDVGRTRGARDVPEVDDHGQ